MDSLEDGSNLRDTPPADFPLILQSLDGQDPHLKAVRIDNHILPRFATTWALAARLSLPELQNRLVLRLRHVYKRVCYHRHATDSPRAVDIATALSFDLDLALDFQQLEEPCGPGSAAERFLVVFYARSCLDLTMLRDGMKNLQQFGNGLQRIAEHIEEKRRV